jgi:hypothetical protein
MQRAAIPGRIGQLVDVVGLAAICCDAHSISFMGQTQPICDVLVDLTLTKLGDRLWHQEANVLNHFFGLRIAGLSE